MLNKNENLDFRRYMKEFQTTNRIITALASTTNIEDIYGIILSSLISPQGLNFTRSILFTYDRKFDTFSGSLALGPSNMEDASNFREELEKEEKALKDLLNNSQIQTESKQSELWENCLSGLKASGLWISTVQRYGLENPITDTVKKLSCSIQSKKPEDCFFYRICKDKTPCIIDQEDSSEKIPPGLAHILDRHFIAIPVTSKLRTYAVVLVDRKFSNIPVSTNDLNPLKWFTNQASMAVDNAILYNELERANEDLREMDVLKSNFLSTISHELRTPLTTVHGFVELILENKVGEISTRQRQLLSRVSRNSKHLINMVNDIIEVSEIQAHGMADIKVVPVDPLPLLLSAINHVKERKDNKKVDIEPIFNGNILKVLSEEHSLERIFYHILDNAVKFSHDDTKVTVVFKKSKSDLSIIISDTGIGMQPEQLQRIFDDFYQADNKLNRAFEGLGLGLTITRLLLTATGGKIFAESDPGIGSIFTIVYPIAK
jgi:signal transduction histidine kinase